MLTVGVMASLAQYEREQISERTKVGLVAAKVRGVVLGGPMLDRDRNTDTTNAIAVRVAEATRRNAELLSVITDIEAEQGAELVRGVASALNSGGYRTVRGMKFSRASVHRIRNACR